MQRRKKNGKDHANDVRLITYANDAEKIAITELVERSKDMQLIDSQGMFSQELLFQLFSPNRIRHIRRSIDFYSGEHLPEGDLMSMDAAVDQRRHSRPAPGGTSSAIAGLYGKIEVLSTAHGRMEEKVDAQQVTMQQISLQLAALNSSMESLTQASVARATQQCTAELPDMDI
jgi:hypothetical protein